MEHIQYRNTNPEKIKDLQRACDRRKVNTPEKIENKKIRNKIYNQSEVGRLKSKLRSAKYSRSRKLKALTPAQKASRVLMFKNWRQRNKDKANALYAHRRASKKNATPPWLTKTDKEEIAELFTVCQMFKVYTGQSYHVDHIAPLTNSFVCGLHILCNLRVIPAFDNLSKNNKFDESLGIDYSAQAYQ